MGGRRRAHRSSTQNYKGGRASHYLREVRLSQPNSAEPEASKPHCWPTMHILPWNRWVNSSKVVETRLRLPGWRQFGRDSTRSPVFRRRDRHRPRLPCPRRCPHPLPEQSCFDLGTALGERRLQWHRRECRAQSGSLSLRPMQAGRAASWPPTPAAPCPRARRALPTEGDRLGLTDPEVFCLGLRHCRQGGMQQKTSRFHVDPRFGIDC